MTRLQSLPSQQHSSGLQRPRQSLRKTRAWANHIAHHCCAGFPQQSYNHQADHANSFATLLHAPAGHRQIDARIPRAAAAWDESADAINMHIYISLSLPLCIYVAGLNSLFRVSVPPGHSPETSTSSPNPEPLQSDTASSSSSSNRI